MNTIYSESTYYLEYIEYFNNELAQLVALRTQKFTQVQMAKKSGVSLRTIQNFEAGKSENLYLFWFYGNGLKGFD